MVSRMRMAIHRRECVCVCATQTHTAHTLLDINDEIKENLINTI
jgi:hypothetical protein